MGVFNIFRKRRKSDTAAGAHANINADAVADRLASLNLQGGVGGPGQRQSAGRQHGQPGEFVGGFSPAVTGQPPRVPSKDASVGYPYFPSPAPYNAQHPGPLPISPGYEPLHVPQHIPPGQMSMTMQQAIPSPVSMTMQHALAGFGPSEPQQLRPPPPDLYPRPYSDPAVPTHSGPSTPTPYPAVPGKSPPSTPHRPPPIQVTDSAPGKLRRASGAPPPLQTPARRQRSLSSPPSPTSASATSSAADTVQCSGTTKNDMRCRNRVKIKPALTYINPDVDVELERFCHLHQKAMFESKEIVLKTKTGEQHVKFCDWIPDYLSPTTQLNLRLEMEKPISKADVPGYIYTFEIRDPSSPKEIQLKVGRAVKLTKRIDEWSKQCGSKQQVLRGFWPGGVEPDDGSLMKGRVRAGEKGAWCHRVERLVHLELADLAVNAPYLEDGFPIMRSKDAPAKRSPKREPCPDCGRMHKEIFTFARPTSGSYKGREWEALVKPVIEKWGAFVEAYLHREGS